MMTMHEKSWTEREEIEIPDLNLFGRMNSKVYQIEKARFDISFHEIVSNNLFHQTKTWFHKSYVS